MKKAAFLLFLLPFFSFKCHESGSLGSEYDSFNPQNCQISGNHGYISIDTDGNQNYPKFVLQVVAQFEKEKKVQVTSFIPQIDIDSESLRGVWVTFEALRDSTEQKM